MPARTALAACALLLAAAPAAAWQSRVEPSGLRVAAAEGEARVGGEVAAARVELRCQPGERGMLEWRLSVAPAAALGFDFGRFEGPDASAAAQRLATLSLEGGLLQARASTALAGWYDEADRFVFAFAAPNGAAADGALLADSIGPQSQALRWVVRESPEGATTLEARFDLADALDPVRDAMAGCGPAPPIGETQRDAWRGRNPHAIDWFAQRAVAWRLKALLGTRHAAILARLGGAGPLATDGETVFLLAPAPDAPRDGVAIMLRGDATEVVLVDGGVVERLVAGRTAIPLPDAVRAFVAERSAAAGG